MIEIFMFDGRFWVRKVRHVILSLFRAEGLYIVNSEDNLREFQFQLIYFKLSFLVVILHGIL